LSSRHFLLLFGNLWWTIPIRRQCFYGLREIFFENLDFFWLSTLFHKYINSRKRMSMRISLSKKAKVTNHIFQEYYLYFSLKEIRKESAFRDLEYLYRIYEHENFDWLLKQILWSFIINIDLSYFLLIKRE
jgi:hypothetical protein